MPCRASSSTATSHPVRDRRRGIRCSTATSHPTSDRAPRSPPQTNLERLGDGTGIPDRNARTPQNTGDRVPRVDIMHLMRNSNGAGQGRRNPAPRSPVGLSRRRVSVVDRWSRLWLRAGRRSVVRRGDSRSRMRAPRSSSGRTSGRSFCLVASAVVACRRPRRMGSVSERAFVIARGSALTRSRRGRSWQPASQASYS